MLGKTANKGTVYVIASLWYISPSLFCHRYSRTERVLCDWCRMPKTNKGWIRCFPEKGERFPTCYLSCYKPIQQATIMSHPVHRQQYSMCDMTYKYVLLYEFHVQSYRAKKKNGGLFSPKCSPRTAPQQAIQRLRHLCGRRGGSLALSSSAMNERGIPESCSEGPPSSFCVVCVDVQRNTY